jgi:hypothetical protein
MQSAVRNSFEHFGSRNFRTVQPDQPRCFLGLDGTEALSDSNGVFITKIIVRHNFTVSGCVSGITFKGRKFPQFFTAPKIRYRGTGEKTLACFSVTSPKEKPGCRSENYPFSQKQIELSSFRRRMPSLAIDLDRRSCDYARLPE